MTKKAGKKKRVIITVTAALVVLLALSVPFVMRYHNYTKEICVMEPVDRMLLRQGVGRDKILVEIGYSIIKNGEVVENYLFVFENGDVYSGYNIDSYYANNYPKEEQWRHLLYFYFSDDRLWDALCEQCYWGRLSPRDLDGIINELAQVDFVYRDFNLDYRMESQMEIQTENPIVLPIGTQSGTEIGIQTEMPMEYSAEWTYDQENNDIYVGHGYLGRMECDGIKSLEWISGGSAENVERYYHDEHAHNAIDIIKSTWAYEQWTNRIFGEGWEERIDLKDELEEISAGYDY
ncbi:MAG: hypothetical protein K2K17_02070 [Lachnospiraceae bacterium]|nr:hypothetical protein [Lachnospiraceae bacterium]